MKHFDSVPWYVAGLAFECQECGQCCGGPGEGFVWVTGEEIESIARFLGLDVQTFRSRHVRTVANRMSLVEDPASRDCEFLTPNAQGGRGCSIYEVRPRQCRTWPFWSINLQSPESWGDSARRCPGINRGKRHSFHEIEARRRSTHE